MIRSLPPIQVLCADPPKEPKVHAQHRPVDLSSATTPARTAVVVEVIVDPPSTSESSPHQRNSVFACAWGSEELRLPVLRNGAAPARPWGPGPRGSGRSRLIGPLNSAGCLPDVSVRGAPDPVTTPHVRGAPGRPMLRERRAHQSQREVSRRAARLSSDARHVACGVNAIEVFADSTMAGRRASDLASRPKVAQFRFVEQNIVCGSHTTAPPTRRLPMGPRSGCLRPTSPGMRSPGPGAPESRRADWRYRPGEQALAARCSDGVRNNPDPGRPTGEAGPCAPGL
jgi:hypothetical protein